MNAIEHIRCRVLDVTQAEMAAIAQVAQSTVSRWERGEMMPNSAALARIRAYALKSKIKWSDSFFWAEQT